MLDSLKNLSLQFNIQFAYPEFALERILGQCVSNPVLPSTATSQHS